MYHVFLSAGAWRNFFKHIHYFSLFFPAFSAAREHSEVHLAACPCGADHVARTTFGHLFPGACRIRDGSWRYSNQNSIAREDVRDVFGADLIECLLIVCFCGFPTASVKGLTAEVDGTWTLSSDVFCDADAPNLFVVISVSEMDAWLSTFVYRISQFHCFIHAWSIISCNLLLFNQLGITFKPVAACAVMHKGIVIEHIECSVSIINVLNHRFFPFVSPFSSEEWISEDRPVQENIQ